MSLLRLTRYDDNGGDDNGGNSDADCTCSLVGRNNMNIDSRHTDNSGRTDADSIRMDSN
jgi:hypothetical protein